MVAYEEDFERLARANAERWAKLTTWQKTRARLRTAWDMAALREWRIAWVSLFSRPWP